MKTRCVSIILILSLLISPLSPAVTLASAASKSSWSMSETGVAFLQELEGFAAEAFQSGGRWYIGYSTESNEEDYPDGITQEEAEELLLEVLDDLGETLNAWLERYDISVNQEQFDALLSFTYNLGKGWMSTDCKLVDILTGILSGCTDADVINAFGVWSHESGTVNTGLINRRMAEAYLFLYGDYEGDFSEDFVYVLLEAADGTVENDIVFYAKNMPFETLPAAERDGYQLKGWQTETGQLLSETDIAQENLSISALWEVENSWVNPFSDVSADDWFYAYVKNLNQAGVIAGYSDGTFGPYDSVTLGAALALILRASGYEDIPEETGTHWASGFLELALSEGILEDTDESELNKAASRLLIAQIIVKALDLSPLHGESPFSDTEDGSVLALYEKGIIQGSNAADRSLVFQPDSSISRAEITAILWRMLNTDIHEGQIQFLLTGNYDGRHCGGGGI